MWIFLMLLAIPFGEGLRFEPHNLEVSRDDKHYVLPLKVGDTYRTGTIVFQSSGILTGLITAEDATSIEADYKYSIDEEPKKLKYQGSTPSTVDSISLIPMKDFPHEKKPEDGTFYTPLQIVGKSSAADENNFAFPPGGFKIHGMQRQDNGEVIYASGDCYVHLNALDQTELKSGLPHTPDLYPYDYQYVVMQTLHYKVGPEDIGAPITVTIEITVYVIGIVVKIIPGGEFFVMQKIVTIHRGH